MNRFLFAALAESGENTIVAAFGGIIGLFVGLAILWLIIKSAVLAALREHAKDQAIRARPEAHLAKLIAPQPIQSRPVEAAKPERPKGYTGAKGLTMPEERK